MTTLTPITKQMHINRFNLSDDLLNVIKGYCFYDIKSWETINFIKYKKYRIHNLFKTGTISRANPYNLYFGDQNTEEHWSFWAFNDDDGPNKQLQAYNCKYCGNYKIIANENRPDKIICHCIVDEYADLPPLIEILSDDEDDDDSIGV